MVILFTPRHLSSYNATFTLSAKKKIGFFILQHEFRFDVVKPGRVHLFQQTPTKQEMNGKHITYGC